MAYTHSARSFHVGLVQMCSGRDVERKCRGRHRPHPQGQARRRRLHPDARGDHHHGARPCAAPVRLPRPEAGNPALATLPVACARELGIFLHIGSMAILVADGRLANRSFLISPAGDIAARYDKIHMFDVDLGGGESYRESANYQPGSRAVLADLPWGKLGLSICYDLRFPASLPRARSRGRRAS